MFERGLRQRPGHSSSTQFENPHVGDTAEMQQWRVFVRQQLQRLAEAGDFSVRTDEREQGADESGERILRYIVAPQGADGRSIVVPNVNSLLPPPDLPPRATRDLLAPYTIQARERSTKVNVPWSRVLRDHKQPETRPRGICTGCEWGAQCTHGWNVPSPRSIIVIAVYDPATSRQRLGWFVRFSDDNKKLVQVPHAVSKKLTWRMENDMVMCTSSLCSTYALESEDEDEVDFVSLAHKSYERIYSNIRMALKRKREDEKAAEIKAKRPAMEPDYLPPPNHEPNTCIVCLEDDEPATTRCPHQKCKAATCLKCHHKARGLCPICDRTAINADYPCSACGQLARLQAYGLPCLSCNSATLCKSCYMVYEECRPCEGAALFRA